MLLDFGWFSFKLQKKYTQKPKDDAEAPQKVLPR